MKMIIKKMQSPVEKLKVHSLCSSCVHSHALIRICRKPAMSMDHLLPMLQHSKDLMPCWQIGEFEGEGMEREGGRGSVSTESQP